MCITAHLRGCRLFLGCAPAKRMARWPKLAANEGETGVEIHERGSSSTAKASRRIDFSGAFTRDYRLVGDARSITRIVMATKWLQTMLQAIAKNESETETISSSSSACGHQRS